MMLSFEKWDRFRDRRQTKPPRNLHGVQQKEGWLKTYDQKTARTRTR
jgi:hypothetical protein